MDMLKRLERLKAMMKEKQLDGVYLTKRENYIYFSGFTGTSAFLLVTQTECLLFTDDRYMEQAATEAKDFKIVNYGGKLHDALKDACKRLDVQRLGVESAYMSVDAYKKYEQTPICSELVPLGNEPDLMRRRKDEEEIRLIRVAVDLADRAFSHVLSYIREGVSENEIAAEIEYFLKKNGARGPSFDTIVASGHRSSLPHGVASDKKIQAGDAIILDFGAIVADYCSDMTRTVFLGKPIPELEKIYHVVKEAQEAAASKVFEGIACREADRIAREVIQSAGYGERFGHGLGHGVGIEIHEHPSLSARSEAVLENGMVVTVEPGIYVPRLGGVRIEDMVLINGNEPIVLTRSGKEFLVL